MSLPHVCGQRVLSRGSLLFHFSKCVLAWRAGEDEKPAEEQRALPAPPVVECGADAAAGTAASGTGSSAPRTGHFEKADAVPPRAAAPPGGGGGNPQGDDDEDDGDDDDGEEADDGDFLDDDDNGGGDAGGGGGARGGPSSELLCLLCGLRESLTPENSMRDAGKGEDRRRGHISVCAANWRARESRKLRLFQRPLPRHTHARLPGPGAPDALLAAWNGAAEAALNKGAPQCATCGKTFPGAGGAEKLAKHAPGCAASQFPSCELCAARGEAWKASETGWAGQDALRVHKLAAHADELAAAEAAKAAALAAEGLPPERASLVCHFCGATLAHRVG